MSAQEVLLAIQALLTLAPQVRSELAVLFSKGEPTPADWEALRAKFTKSYDQLRAEAGIPPQNG